MTEPMSDRAVLRALTRFAKKYPDRMKRPTKEELRIAARVVASTVLRELEEDYRTLGSISGPIRGRVSLAFALLSVAGEIDASE